MKDLLATANTAPLASDDSRQILAGFAVATIAMILVGTVLFAVILRLSGSFAAALSGAGAGTVPSMCLLVFGLLRARTRRD